MMRYFLRRRRSAIYGTGFSRLAGLILAAVLLPLLAPVELRANVRADGAYGGAPVLWERTKTVVKHVVGGLEDVESWDTGATFSAPSRQGISEQYTERERFGLKGAEGEEHRTAYRYRYLQQIKLLLWYLLEGLLGLSVLFCQRFGDGRIRQRELVSRGRLIVSYLCRSDGKKNGMTSYIK
ncbi:MAG: hypothetical protein ACLT3H_04825 [Roseburia sp.]